MIYTDRRALELFSQSCELYIKHCSQRRGPDGHEFVSILKACSLSRALSLGQVVFSHVVESDFAHNLHIHNTLINMYGRCGSLDDALGTFNYMLQKDVISWNVLIGGYAHVQPYEALQLLSRMHCEGFIPDKYTYVSVLKVCAELRYLMFGKLLHHLIVLTCLERDVFVGSALIDMYTSCGGMAEAESLFDCLPERNLVTWNAIISGYVGHTNEEKAFSIFSRMLNEGNEELSPNQVSFVSMLKVCSNLALLLQGALIHAYIIEKAYEFNVFLISILIDMYSQCGNLDDSIYVFHMSWQEDPIIWGALVAAFVRHGHDHEALHIFRCIQHSALHVNAATYICVLKACTNLNARQQGKMIHMHVVESTLASQTTVSNALIDMHVKCGSVKDARVVFDMLQEKDLITWNSMIAGYAEQCNEEAFKLFDQMQEHGESPDIVTIISVLKGCSRLCNLDEGKLVHDYLRNKSFSCSLFVKNALIDMYAKCGSLSEAHKLFYDMQNRDAVTWSAMITGLVQCWRGEDAIFFFQQMLQEGISPNEGVLVGILHACAIEAALYVGKLVHSFVVELDLLTSLAVGNSLIGMYSNSGSCDDAYRVFQTIENRNEVTWTSIITCFGRYENYRFALQCYAGMLKEGLSPNAVTFVSLLSSCSRIGLMGEACGLFGSISTEHQIVLTAQHYNCMVDLMGRTNQIKKAEELLVSMPFYVNAIGWSCLLGHCKTHGNVEIGKRCFDKIMILDPEDRSAYALMLSIYAEAGMHKEIELINSGLKIR
ncbi:hypothetical protein KP509_36G021900 [Ceratopteris richardii]|uniref:Pentatricopeptide repeat-containing protein n=1 Tax=Ceratopteris richardii TaxID=49495 RepID=A0A8T2QBE1_CERRI|nr:hypothetical protein KP509_36G021900 [Ceratopteris richardii]